MASRKKITVSGAGLVGSLLSVLLGQRGYEVTILERRPDSRLNPQDSGRSINLALSSRGIRALEMAGLMDEVQELLIPMPGRMLHFENGETEFMPYGQRENEVIYSVSRRDLNNLMLTAAIKAEAVNVVFEQKLESIDFENLTYSVRDLNEDKARTKEFDLLIGADGAGSRTRRALMQVVDGTTTSEFLDHDYKELEIPAVAIGNDEADEVPIDDDRRYRIEKKALHIWPRGEFMLIALPNQGGSFTVTLFMPKKGENSFESLKDRVSVRTFFEREFPDALKLIPELEVDYFDNPQGLLGTVRCSPWHYKDVCLILGDASHAIVPFHGQGMNAGFEDCSELIRLLDKHDEDWEATIKEFDRIRKPNADAIADMAIENYTTMRSSVIDPKFQLKKEIGFELEKRFPDRFVPRYSMVMFHCVPYAETYKRGAIQQEILTALAEDCESVSKVDFDKAEALIKERLNVVDLGGV